MNDCLRTWSHLCCGSNLTCIAQATRNLDNIKVVSKMYLPFQLIAVTRYILHIFFNWQSTLLFLFGIFWFSFSQLQFYLVFLRFSKHNLSGGIILSIACLVVVSIKSYILSSFFFFWQGSSILADSGTEQLEFIALSQRTGEPKYQQKVIVFCL